VNQISIDDNGDYMASCSDDGRVHNDVVIVKKSWGITTW